MISYVRPPEPAGFATDAARLAAARAIRDKVAPTQPLPPAPPVPAKSIVSADFKDVWGDHKRAFIDAQGQGKCGYCETRVTASSPGDVEHYRPKTELKEASDQGTRKSPPKRRDRTRKYHPPLKPGYWWLAYEWDNWLFACTHCNSSWKVNQFPVATPRPALAEGAEKTEQPLLLNPFVDPRPEVRFSFLRDGDIVGLDAHARATIEVCGLDRWDLVDERGRVAQSLLRTLADFPAAVAEGSAAFQKSVLRRVAEACRPEAQFAGMCRRLVDAATELGGLTAKDILDLDKQGKLS